MKPIMLITFLTLVTFAASGQKLAEIYKKGVVKLVPDHEYAQDNDWNKVFHSYYDTLYGKPMGDRKSLKLLPDGSVLVNHAYRNFYTKFSPLGKFEKELFVKNSKGEPFKKIKSAEGVVNGNTFFTEADNMGNIICFDLNGNYKKTLKIDYMTHQMIPLPGNKIAVVGWAIWNSKFRDFVAVIDYETNQQKIIWDFFTDRTEYDGKRKPFNYGYRFKSGGMIGCNTMPFTKDIGMTSPPVIASVDNKLIVAIPITGEIRIYDLEGKLLSRDKTEWARNYITANEQKEIQQKAINEYKSAKNLFGKNEEESNAAKEYFLKAMETDLGKISDPIPLPCFSTILKDSDGNLLFFEFAREENANKFNVWIYENDGKFLCRSSFVCDDYNLEINPSKMVFYLGYIYGLQLLKKADGVPLRLVRFKVSSD